MLDQQDTIHAVEADFDTIFSWDYERSRGSLVKLYEKAKTSQWNASTDLDWSIDVDPEKIGRELGGGGTMRFQALQDAEDSPVKHFGEKEWRQVSVEIQNSLLSQFMHGEQGALMAAARIVQTAPDLDAKFYAATQVMDEARHVEAYARLLNEKLGIAYPITPGLKSLLETVLTDRRWDMTYLGMQILIEGLALAAFQRIRDFAKNQLAASVNAYVMQDEARHVAFGRLALRDLYPQLTDAERSEREEFVVEACYQMRDRFNQKELWEKLGLPVQDAVDAAMSSENMRLFRKRLFSRIVPTVKDIGLWGPGVQKAFVDMGAIEFADIDSAAVLEQDQKVAEQFDARRFVQESIA